MKLEFSLLCLFVLCVVAQKKPVKLPTAECSRVECRMLCPYGFALDNNGCPVCDCMSNPCDLMDCEGECRPYHACTDFPCAEMAGECIDTMPCPMPMCARECPLGYKTDSHGCMSCNCVENEQELCDDHSCPMMHSCIPVKFEDVKKPVCLPDGHHDNFHPHGPAIPDEIGHGLFESLCHFKKKFADKMQARTMKMSNTSLFRSVLRQAQHHMPMCTEDGDFHPVQCHGLAPLCWCVNDRGVPVPDSRVQVQEIDDMPTCARHVTNAVDGEFMLRHALKDVMPHMDKIRSLVKENLAKMMDIKEAELVITHLVAEPGADQQIRVHFSIRRGADGSDLSGAEMKLTWHMSQGHFELEYEGTTLSADPKSLQMKHHTEPVEDGEMTPLLPEHGLIVDRYYGHESRYQRCSRFYHHHKIAVIAGGCGILIFLITIIVIIVTVCKRKAMRGSHQFDHQRLNEKSDKYKENLAFVNEIYGTQATKPGLEVEEPTKEQPTEEVKEVTEDDVEA